MKRLEIIHLRLAGPGPEGFVQSILDSVHEHAGLERAQVYRSVPVDSDLSIHLHLDADPNDAQATELGLRLAAALEEYGMVKHTFWREETGE